MQKRQFNTLAELLIVNKDQYDTGITFIESSQSEEFLSYGDLYRQAVTALCFFQNNGITPGNELVFQIEDNKNFIIAFWACILGGIIPVPLSVGQNDDHKQKLFNVWPVLHNPYLLISPSGADKLKTFSERQGLSDNYLLLKKKMLQLTGLLSSGQEGQVILRQKDDIAFIQFSSGSTGTPKGVILTHNNLLTNINAISHAAGYAPGDAMLSWMPLTHDMGLIGFHINPLFSGINQFLMPTSLFIRRPALWFDKATRHKVSILCSPNFGYEYVSKHCDLSSPAYTWDLSAVRLIYNGAEPISVSSCRNFLQQMSKYGLKSRAMCPVYGLAEASLAVSISGMEDEMIAIAVDRNTLAMGDKINPGSAGTDPSFLVNVGKPVRECLVRIADGSDQAVAEEIVGQVQIHGDNVTKGYYNNIIQTQNNITADGWMRTGDLGFIRHGSLYITGRIKDIIFKNGQNYYSHDLEDAAREVEGIELNKIVIGGIFNEEIQRDEVIAFLLHRASPTVFITIAQSLKALLNRKFGFEIDQVIPVKDIPRTTSGKLQRYKLIDQYRKGCFADSKMEWPQSAGHLPPPGDQPTPQNAHEQQLLEIWTDVLNTKAIGITHHFFSIGGNSLKAAEMAMHIQKEFGLDLPLPVIYEKPTIRELATEIAVLKNKEYTPIPVREDTVCPLAPAQKRIYYSWAMDKSSIAYNIPVAFEIIGDLDIDRLENGIRQLVEIHDSLRTVFYSDSEPRSRTLATVKFNLQLSQSSRQAADILLPSLVRPFDLETGPLFRIHLIKTAAHNHLLFADFHHSISDGLSVFQFIRELLLLYNGEELDTPTLQYKDYVFWQKDTLLSDRLKVQESYWMHRLKGELPVLELPSDFSRPVVFQTKGGKIEFEWEKKTVHCLKELAIAQDCTLHVLLFTLYNILLSKYTGQKDIIIGVPVSGRRHPDLLKMSGMFVNSLPVRNFIKKEDSFSVLLAKTNKNMLDALDNQDYPFDEMITKIGGKRNSSRNPLFDTMFIYQNMGIPGNNDTGLRLHRHFFDPGFAKFDLSLEVFEEGDSLKFSFEYAATLFKKETILQMASHYTHLAEKILASPGIRFSELSPLSATENQDYFRRFSLYPAGESPAATIHQLFEEQTLKTPDSIAIEYGQEKITYLQLDKQADLLAHLLRKEGVAPNVIVGVMLKRSPALIVSILGILKAGGAYLPIETSLPAERIKFLLSNSQCRLIITGNAAGDQQLLSELPGCKNIRIDALDLPVGIPMVPSGIPTASGISMASNGISTKSGSIPTASAAIPTASGGINDMAGPDHLAYVIYTSGTTGQPKGVMIGHASLVNYCTWASETYIKEDAVAFPFYTSVSFDLTITSIFPPLLTGNKIVIYGDTASDTLIEAIIADNKVDIIKLTPSHLKLMAETKTALPASKSRIKRLIVGGEQLETKLTEKISDKFQGEIEIYNEYGPTEATVGCMIHKFQKGSYAPAVPIGIAAPNTGIYLLDDSLQLVPTGVKGEIYIGGLAIAKGYLFNEVLTEQKFIPDPFAEGKKMYKTGDIGRLLPEGILEYIGRYDQQVKINGYRIELQEIETCLAAYPGLTGALVAVRENKGQKYIYAYYVSNHQWDKDTGNDPGHDEEAILKKYMATALPEYMIPLRFVRLEEIPLTRNGKVDYESLPAPGFKKQAIHRPMPGNEIEQLSLKIWEEVLGEQDLCVIDDFYQLGGDSIKAVQISSRLFEKGIAVNVKEILTYHTIRQISEYARPVSSGDKYRQTVMQGEKRWSPMESWFFYRQLANPHFFNQSVLLAFHKIIDPELLARAFQELITHHDGLRLNVNPENKSLYYNNQWLGNKFSLEIHEIEDAQAPDFIEHCQRIKGSLNIYEGLLLKAAILKEKAGKELLFITAHHLVIDGLSWRILLEDLYIAYQALEEGKEIRLPRKTASLTDWEIAIREYSAAMPGEEADFWASVKAKTFSLPQDFDTTDWRAKNMNKIVKTLSKEDTAFLLKGAHIPYKTDVPILLNAALAMALKTWTGLDQLVVEQENHGRHLETVDTSRTVGWFTAMYPLRLEMIPASSGELIKVIKEQVRKIPQYGMGYMTGSYSGDRPLSTKEELTAIRFNYLGRFDKEFHNDLFSYSEIPTGIDTDPSNSMTAGLELNSMILDGKFRMEISYNSKAHAQSSMNWLADSIFSNLTHLLEYLRNPEEIHLTPSDFGIVGMDQDELDALF